VKTHNTALHDAAGKHEIEFITLLIVFGDYIFARISGEGYF
jgi:hypothetical protein